MKTHSANEIQSWVQSNTFPLHKPQGPPCWTCTPSLRWAQRDGEQHHDMAQEGARHSHRWVRFLFGKSLWKKASFPLFHVSGLCSETAVPSSAAGLPSATSPVPSATKHQAKLQSCNVSHACPFHWPSLHIPNLCLWTQPTQLGCKSIPMPPILAGACYGSTTLQTTGQPRPNPAQLPSTSSRNHNKKRHLHAHQVGKTPPQIISQHH